MATTTELVNEILTEFREISVSPISTSATECLEFLNWGYQDYCSNATPYRSAATRTVFAYNNVVELPVDCMKLDQVYQGQTKLDVRTYEEMDDIDTKWRIAESSGKPNKYIPLSYNKGEIYPKLTVAATLNYFGYYAMPPALDFAGSDPVTPETGHDDLKKYVLALLHAKTRNIDLAISNIGVYSEKRKDFMKDSYRGQTETKVMTMKLPSRSTYGRIRKDR
jgi:hypothetical protein